MTRENLTVWEKYPQGTNYINQYNDFIVLRPNGEVETELKAKEIKKFLSKMLGLYDTDTNCGVINIGPEDLERFIKKSNCNRFKYILNSTNMFEDIVENVNRIESGNMLIAIIIKNEDTNMGFENILLMPRFNNQNLNNLITIGIDNDIVKIYKYLILYS